jgi:hypothetical protein
MFGNSMNYFFFWLTIAAAIGGIVAPLLGLGVIELVLLVIVANLLFNAYRRFGRSVPSFLKS